MLPQIPRWLRLQLHTLPAAREGFLLPREQKENPLQSCSPFSHTPAFPMGMGLFQRHGSSAGAAARQPAAVCWGGLQKGFWLAVLCGCGCSALGLKLMWQHGAELRWVGLQPPWGLGCPQSSQRLPSPQSSTCTPTAGTFSKSRWRSCGRREAAAAALGFPAAAVCLLPHIRAVQEDSWLCSVRVLSVFT